jgi:hypothetical protein
MEICGRTEPVMQRFSDGHTAACHLYNEMQPKPKEDVK